MASIQTNAMTEDNFTEAFAKRSLCAKELLHKEALTQSDREVFAQEVLSHIQPLQRSFCTQTLLHSRAFTHRRLYTQKLFAHRSFYFTCRSVCPQKLLHTLEIGGFVEVLSIDLVLAFRIPELLHP